MKKVLVTGATGFIGNYVVQEVLRNECIVIATSVNEQKAKLMPWFNQVTYIPFDLAQFDPAINYSIFFQEPDLIIHLAWEGLPNYKSSFHVETNLPRHFNLLTNLVRHGLRDLTITGTCFEYGMQEGRLSEDMLAVPSNSYAIAKDQLRRALMDLGEKYPLILKWPRLFYMYGKGQNPNSLLSQLDKALDNNEKSFNMSGGEQVRDYLPVEKVAEYITRIAFQNKVSGVINCCSGQPVTIEEFVENYLMKKNKKINLNLGFYPYPDYEPMHFWGDNSKLKTILNNE